MNNDGFEISKELKELFERLAELVKDLPSGYERFVPNEDKPEQH